MTIKQLPACNLDYDVSLKCVIQKWEGYSNSDEFRQAIMETLNFFQSNKQVMAIISDTRRHKVVRTADTDWVVQEINPQLIEKGLKKMAFVLPQDQFAGLSVDRFTKISDNFEIGNFDSIESAKEWIRSS